MTKIVIVIPYVDEVQYRACYNSLTPAMQDFVYDLDNTDFNRGVAGSWNQGIEEMRRQNADWLIIVSSSMRFGDKGGEDMLAQIDKHSGADIIRFAQASVPRRRFNGDSKSDNPSYPEAFYWHCTAINRTVVDQVGNFDANFYPIYFEDTDYDLRILKAGFRAGDLIVPIDAHSSAVGYSVASGKVTTDTDKLIAYFATKWGVHPSAIAKLGTYDKPFDDPQNDIKYWPAANGQVHDE